jgi:HK97 family phage major capsid protein
VLSEPTAYGRGSGQSYFLDQARIATRHSRAGEAQERMNRHAQQVDVDLPARQEARAKRAAADLESLTHVSGARHHESGFERRTNPNRTDGQGGYFVPPLWLIDEYIPFLRAGATAANLCHNMPLPDGTDSINLPKVATGTTTAIQTADAGTVSSTDLTDSTISAPVRTIAGQQDIAMQLLDQSPVAFDEIVFKDLMADYNKQKDTQVLTGSGSSGQLKGIANVSSINAVTYTDASPTVPELYLPLAQALSQIARTRLLPPTGILFTSLRWYWIMSALDSSNRPLVTPNGPAFNQIADAAADTAEGFVGGILGVGAYGDNNIPTNLGGGTNQDEVFAAKWDDLYLWEGVMRSRTLVEVLSNTLQVRLQIYNYLAFMGDRYPSAIATINGTGLITPSGF